MADKPIVHLKGLNGIRAIAAIAVVFSHIRLTKGFGLPVSKSLELASFGVTIFFSLSGFLITYLLLIEKERFTTIDVKQFYIRRILRIWPLYYLYVLLSVVYLFIYEPHSLPGSIFWYVFLSANVPFITSQALPVLVHFWSLGVEEQFYIFWPWLVKAKNKLTFYVTAFIVTILILKFFCWLYFLKTENGFPLSIIQVTRFHCMAIGALGALFYSDRHRLFLRAGFSQITQVICWGVVLLLFLNHFHIASVIDHELIAVITVFLIVNVAGNDRSLIKLDSKAPDYVGKISFGIYVYHPLIILLIEQWLGNMIKSYELSYRYILVYTIVLISTFTIAGISYYFYEKRFLNLKVRFSKIHSR